MLQEKNIRCRNLSKCDENPCFCFEDLWYYGMVRDWRRNRIMMVEIKDYCRETSFWKLHLWTCISKSVMHGVWGFFVVVYIFFSGSSSWIRAQGFCVLGFIDFDLLLLPHFHSKGLLGFMEFYWRENVSQFTYNFYSQICSIDFGIYVFGGFHHPLKLLSKKMSS